MGYSLTSRIQSVPHYLVERGQKCEEEAEELQSKRTNDHQICYPNEYPHWTGTIGCSTTSEINQEAHK